MGAGKVSTLMAGGVESARRGAGRLTVFLGVAPGVGKTGAMLARARELRREGGDVAVGLVDAHTDAAWLDGLPVIEPLRPRVQGRLLPCLDLDAVLARQPATLVVDDLARRNPAGARHEWRWQDVEEVLKAGIDVYTAFDIQQLASLNDEVQQLTGRRVVETVPDVLLDHLRDVRLVDLPPRALIERLRRQPTSDPCLGVLAGYTPATLAGLRELAMQVVADHDDTDLRAARAARGVGGPSLNRHVLVAIDGSPHAEMLVRAGSRIAERRAVPWSVVHIETGPALAAAQPARLDQSASRRDSLARAQQQRQMALDRAFALARSLGGDTELLHGEDVPQALLDAAAVRGARSIVIGRARRPHPLRRLLGRTLTQQLLTRGARYELTIISAPQPQARPPGFWGWLRSERVSSRELRILLGSTVAAVAVAALAQRWFELQEVTLVFLVAVLGVAARTRLSTALLMAALCFAAYVFVFIEPRYALVIDARRGVVTALGFLAAALIAGRLASRLRMQVVALRAANAHARAIQELGRRLMQAADSTQVVLAGAAALQATLKAEAWVRSGSAAGPTAAGRHLEALDLEAAAWCEAQGQPCGRYTDTFAMSSWWLLPLRVDQQVLGVVALRFPADVSRLTFSQRRLAAAMASDIAQAALRARLVADLEAARVANETERLRAALLASVSHDLRSPLAAMIGAADSLADYGAMLPEADRSSLLATIREEGERLDRYIQNLLDMTRLGQQGLTLARDWIGVDELVGAASTRLQRYLPQTSIEVAIEPGLPSLHVHPALIEQALFNVMENAAHFSPPGVSIRVAAQRLPESRVCITVTDEGPGIPADERTRIFDMFYSVARGDRGRQGTGLGLSIVQGIIGAHQGQIEALPGPQGRGTTLRITLPWGERPPNEEADA